jgi:Zn-dependent protease/CBS domain-containing protein
MGRNIKIGAVFGVPIELDFSWFLIFGLITWSLASGYLPQAYPEIPTWAIWMMGLIASLLFFGSVLMHELGHTVVAQREGVPVRRIRLFFFGGLAQITREPSSPGAEFRIAIAGPVVSLLLAGVFGGIYLLDQAIPYLAAPSIWLARLNLILAVFNMIPGFPLDGGRVLRSYLWKRTGSVTRATRMAAGAGQVVAMGFIGFGVFRIFTGDFFGGLWLAFIGWFMQNAASVSVTQSRIQEVIQDIRVNEVMRREFPSLSGFLSLRQIVDKYVLGEGQRSFFVVEDGQPEGLLSVGTIRRIPQRKWPFTRANQAMVPMDQLTQVQEDEPLQEALQAMDQVQAEEAPVVRDGIIVGVLRREDVHMRIQLKAELGT